MILNMEYTDIYRSAYLKAEDLSGRTAKHTISSCTAEKVGDDERLVLAFSENDRSLVLNKTNATTLAELYGPETGAWGRERNKTGSFHHFLSGENGQMHPDQS